MGKNFPNRCPNIYFVKRYMNNLRIFKNVDFMIKKPTIKVEFTKKDF